MKNSDLFCKKGRYKGATGVEQNPGFDVESNCPSKSLADRDTKLKKCSRAEHQVSVPNEKKEDR